MEPIISFWHFSSNEKTKNAGRKKEKKMKETHVYDHSLWYVFFNISVLHTIIMWLSEYLNTCSRAQNLSIVFTNLKLPEDMYPYV